MTNLQLIDLLHAQHRLEENQWVQLFSTWTEEDLHYAMDLAREITVKQFGRKIYFRGIVEFSNICKNDCYYCGIRRSNDRADRYRLSPEDILNCCRHGYKLGFRNRCQHCSLRCSIDLFFYFNSQVQRDFVDRCVRCYRP